MSDDAMLYLQIEGLYGSDVTARALDVLCEREHPVLVCFANLECLAAELKKSGDGAMLALRSQLGLDYAAEQTRVSVLAGLYSRLVSMIS